MNQPLNPDNFFENTGGGGAPSFKFAAVNYGLIGPIVSQSVVDATVFATNPPQPKLDPDRKSVV